MNDRNDTYDPRRAVTEVTDHPLHADVPQTPAHDVVPVEAPGDDTDLPGRRPAPPAP